MNLQTYWEWRMDHWPRSPSWFGRLWCRLRGYHWMELWWGRKIDPGSHYEQREFDEWVCKTCGHREASPKHQRGTPGETVDLEYGHSIHSP